MKKLREHISLKAIITSVMILSLIIASCSFDLEPAWKNSEKTAITINFSTFSSTNENITETRALIKGSGNLYLVLDSQVYGPYLATPGIPFITTDIPSGTYSFVMALFSATSLDKLTLSSLNSNSHISEIAAIGSGKFTYQSLNDFTVYEGKTNEIQLTLIPAVGSELTLTQGNNITLIPENGEVSVRRFLKTGDYTSGLSQGEIIDSLEITTVNLAQTPEISLTAELHVYNNAGKEVGVPLPINQVTGGESTYILNQPGDGPYFIYIEYTTTNAKALQVRMNLTIGIVEATPFTLSETVIGSDTMQIKQANSFTMGGTVISAEGKATLKAFRGSTQILLITSVLDANTVNWSYSESDLADGSYIYEITATNSDSAVLSLTRNIQVDTTAPTIDITTPADGQTVDHIPFAFNGSVTDTTSGVQKVEYSFDNNNWNNASFTGNTWSFVYGNFSNGNYTLYTRATDNAGKIAEQSRNFTVALPSFTLTETVVGSDAVQIKQTNSLALGGTIISSDGNISLSAKRNGVPIQVSSEQINETTLNWSYSESSLIDGNYNYVIMAINSASETLAINRNFQIDTTAPTIDITTPAVGQTVDHIPFAFNGSVTDTTSGVQKVEYSFDNNNWNEASFTGSTWSYVFNNLTSGNFTLYVRATDKAGNILTQSKSFTVDLPAFTLSETVIGLDTMQTLNVNSFTLGGTVTSPDGDISITATKNGDAIQLSYETVNATTVNWSYSEINLPDNIYNYVITAKNSKSETLSIGRYIRIDTIAPYITITDPSPGQKIYKASHVFHGSVTDGASGVENVEYSFDNTTWDAASFFGSSWSCTQGNLSDGNLTLYVRSTDNAGNIATINETFIVEVTIFSLTETTFNSADLQLKSSGPIILIGTVTSPDGEVTLTATKNGIPITLTTDTTPTGLTWSLSDYSIQDGLYEYVFTATNSTSDVLTLSRNFHIDGIAPIILINSPQENQVIEYLPYEFSGTISDAGTGIKTFSYSLDSENWYPFEPTEESWSINFNNTMETSFNLYLQAFDYLNNQAYFVIPFTTSFPVPIVNETQLGPGAPVYRTSYPYNIGGTIVTPIGGHVTFTVTKNGVSLPGVVPTTTDSMTWNWNYEETTGIQGTFNYEITATSYEGKTTVLNRQVCVDWDPPQIMITSPSEGQTITLAAFTGFTGYATDNASGIASAQYQIDGGAMLPLMSPLNWSIPNPGLLAGTHTINIIALDAAGNMMNVPPRNFTLAP